MEITKNNNIIGLLLIFIIICLYYYDAIQMIIFKIETMDVDNQIKCGEGIPISLCKLTENVKTSDKAMGESQSN
jgi:hypothetical protein